MDFAIQDEEERRRVKGDRWRQVMLLDCERGCWRRG
jgi:hypothetical protein